MLEVPRGKMLGQTDGHRSILYPALRTMRAVPRIGSLVFQFQVVGLVSVSWSVRRILHSSFVIFAYRSGADNVGLAVAIRRSGSEP